MERCLLPHGEVSPPVTCGDWSMPQSCVDADCKDKGPSWSEDVDEFVGGGRLRAKIKVTALHQFILWCMF